MTSTLPYVGATVRSNHTRKTARVVYVCTVASRDLLGPCKTITKLGLSFNGSPMWICSYERFQANYHVL